MGYDERFGLRATVGEDDSLHDECGVFGVWAPGRDVARITYFGLHALQHRGQESAGIAVGNGKSVLVRKDRGLVSQVFTDADLSALSGKAAIGHVRYGTAGGGGFDAAQPHFSLIDDVTIALAHNGTLVNTMGVRRELVQMGVPFRSETDSEVACELIGYFTKKSGHLRVGIRHAMQMIEGGYAMVLLRENALYAFRDPNGIRPLVIGALGTEGWVVASETCALDIVGHPLGAGDCAAPRGAVHLRGRVLLAPRHRGARPLRVLHALRDGSPAGARGTGRRGPGHRRA